MEVLISNSDKFREQEKRAKETSGATKNLKRTRMRKEEVKTKKVAERK